MVVLALSVLAGSPRSHAQWDSPRPTLTPIRRDAEPVSGSTATAPNSTSTSASSTGDAGARSSATGSSVDTPSRRSTTSPWGSFVVLGGILLVIVVAARWLKWIAPGRFQGLPEEAVSWLGKRVIAANQELHLVKVGDRILVLGSGPDGLRTLSEISDSSEVAHLEIAARHSSSPKKSRASREIPRPLNRSTPPAQGSPNPQPSVPMSHRNRDRNDPVDARLRQQTGQHESEYEQESVDQSSAESSRTIPTDRSGNRSRSALGCLFAMITLHALAFPASAVAQMVPDAPSVRYDANSSRGTPQRDGSNLSRFAASDGVDAVRSEGSDSSEQVAAGSSLTLSGVAPFAPSQLWSTIRMAALVSVVSLAPAILMMTTCYVRIVIVLGLLRQAIGTSQFPPTQVLTALSLFLTALVMWPVWQRSYQEGIRPYVETTHADAASQEVAMKVAIERSIQPVRQFMCRQIEATGNESAIDLLLDFRARDTQQPVSTPRYYEEVPLEVLLPAFLLSELKTAFLIGFQIYLPFLILDLVVSAVLASLGLVMLPPAVVSLPFKLLLFVLIDGWYLTVQLLLNSFASS